MDDRESALAAYVKIAAEAAEIFRTKNAYYGTENISRAGVEGVLARIEDKVGRLRQLVKMDDQAMAEAMAAEDSGLDLSNYGNILVALLRGLWPASGGAPTQHYAVAPMLFRTTSDAGGIAEPQHAGDVGYDLSTSERVILPVRAPVRYVGTGVHIKCPPGCWARLCGRSSTMMKYGILVTEGVIDTGFTGELRVGMINMSDEAVTIEAGTRIAQVILIPAITRPIRRVEVLPETERGHNGFGSTGATSK